MKELSVLNNFFSLKPFIIISLVGWGHRHVASWFAHVITLKDSWVQSPASTPNYVIKFISVKRYGHGGVV